MKIRKFIILFLLISIFPQRDSFARRIKEVKIAEIEPIEEPVRRIRFKNKDIPDFIELPLQKAIEIFYDKNILTTMSSANRKDINKGFAYIKGDISTLSEENRRILDELVKQGIAEINEGWFILKVSLSSSSTGEEVSKRFVEIAEMFAYQRPIWIEQERFTWESFKERFGISDDQEVLPLIEKLGYYFDSQSGFIYYSQEHYDKVREYYLSREKR